MPKNKKDSGSLLIFKVILSYLKSNLFPVAESGGFLFCQSVHQVETKIIHGSVFVLGCFLELNWFDCIKMHCYLVFTAFTSATGSYRRHWKFCFGHQFWHQVFTWFLHFKVFWILQSESSSGPVNKFGFH